MADSKSLKEQNAWLIRATILTHIIVFAWIAIEPLRLVTLDGRDVVARLESAAAPGTASLGLIVIASLLLLGMIPPNWRDRLIHWRWNNPLPGCRAFTRIGPGASQIDMTVISTRYGPLPEGL